MSSSTRQALAQAKSEISSHLAEAGFATDLFKIADAIASSSGLRGMLSDPSTESSAKSVLIQRVFSGKVSGSAIEFLNTFVAKRFSSGADLVAVLEQLGVYALASTKAEQVDKILGEMFAFEQLVASDQELQFALSSKSAPNEAKLALIEKLVSNKVDAATKTLLSQAVLSSRGRKVGVVLNQFIKQVADFGRSLVANITVANAISDLQAEQLRNNLAKTYGQAVKLNIEVNPAIIGGIVVEVAGEIIDGSISSRMSHLKQELAHAAASVNRS